MSETSDRGNRSLQDMKRLRGIFHVRAFGILLDKGIHKNLRCGKVLPQTIVQLAGEPPSLVVLYAH